MNKEEKEQKLKELSRKYFWEQKIIEVLLFLLIFALSLIALYISGSIMLKLDPSLSTAPLFVVGFIGLGILTIIGIACFGIGYGVWTLLKEWIENNKEKASERAKKELGIKPDDDYWDF